MVNGDHGALLVDVPSRVGAVFKNVSVHVIHQLHNLVVRNVQDQADLLKIAIPNVVQFTVNGDHGYNMANVLYHATVVFNIAFGNVTTRYLHMEDVNVKDLIDGNVDVLMIGVRSMVNGVLGECLLLAIRRAEEDLIHVTDCVTLLHLHLVVTRAQGLRLMTRNVTKNLVQLTVNGVAGVVMEDVQRHAVEDWPDVLGNVIVQLLLMEGNNAKVPQVIPNNAMLINVQ